MGNSANSAKLLAAELGVYCDICKSLGTPRALASYMLVKAGEYHQLLDLPPPDRDFCVNPDFPDDYLLAEMVRKNPRLPLGINRRNVAGRSWCASERRNRSTNIFLRSTSWKQDSNLVRAVLRARRIVARTLGPLDESTFDSILEASRHGPGATSTVRGKNISPATKMITSLGVTPDLWPLRQSITPLWQDETVGFVPEFWDTWINVPKNAKTDRGICINPGLNVFLQLGIGGYLRERLKLLGLDIRNAQSRHKWLVGLCQRLGLATIDLSAASDSICYELVKLLLPKRWFFLLDMLRTSHTRIYGKLVHNAKFAAMGNGFTFELETLIFWALVQSVDEIMVMDGMSDVKLLRFASAYGDDLIVQQNSAPELVRVLGLLGFETNKKKTFLAGSFFESCGSDVWEGHDVRPFYLDSDPDDFTEAVVLMANAVRIYAHRRAGFQGCDRKFLRPWLNIVSHCDKAKKTGMPVTWSQRDSRDIERTSSISAASGLIRNFDEFRPKRLNTVVFGPATDPDGYIGVMYYQPPKLFTSGDYLYHVGCYIVRLKDPGNENGDSSTEYARKSRDKGRLKSTVVPSWTDVGPWVNLQDRRG